LEILIIQDDELKKQTPKSYWNRWWKSPWNVGGFKADAEIWNV